MGDFYDATAEEIRAAQIKAGGQGGDPKRFPLYRTITGRVTSIGVEQDDGLTMPVVVEDSQSRLHSLRVASKGDLPFNVTKVHLDNVVRMFVVDQHSIIAIAEEPAMTDKVKDLSRLTDKDLSCLADLDDRFHAHVPTPDDDTKALAGILERVFGAKVFDDGVGSTAKRVMKYWNEVSGTGVVHDEVPIPGATILPFEFTVFKADPGQIVTVPGIEFSSLCAHHLLPFMGVAHIAYIANKVQVGLSKIPRLVDFWSRRPQVQERLTAQLAKDLKIRLDPHGVMVVIEASHSCMSCRGVRKHNGAMVTSRPEGMFMSNPAARDEFFALIAPHRIK